ncbi:11588_t:CDS:1, partial [Cetraspora pellucida]
ANKNKENYEKTFKTLQQVILNNYKNELLVQTNDSEIERITNQAKKEYNDAKNEIKKTIKEKDKYKQKFEIHLKNSYKKY